MARPLLFMPALLALSLTACGEGPGTDISINARTDDGNTSISADGSGNISIRAPGFSGSFDLPKFTLKAEDFDINGVSLYPGSTITGANVEASERSGSEDRAKALFTFESPAGMREVQQWFATQMRNKGFTVETRDDGLSGTTRDGQPFGLALSTLDANRTRGVLTVGQ